MLTLCLAGAVLLPLGCKQSSKPAAAPGPENAVVAEQKSAASGQIAAPNNCVPPDCKNDAAPAGAPTQAASAAPVVADVPTTKLKLDREFRSLLYSVFFRYASAQLGPSGRSTVANLHDEALNATHIVLTGRTDTSGDPVLNEKLAQQRADAVKRGFSKIGVQSSVIDTRIDTSGKTELEPGTVTPLLPQIDVLRARRVDIFIETLQDAKKP